MAKIHIDITETFPFATELDVYIEHINAGQRLGNERLVGLLNEARLRYVASCHCKKMAWIRAALSARI